MDQHSSSGRDPEEQKELLLEVLQHEGYHALEELLERLSDVLANNMLKYDLKQGFEGLALLRAETDGAGKLLNALRAARKQLLAPKIKKPNQSAKV